MLPHQKDKNELIKGNKPYIIWNTKKPSSKLHKMLSLTLIYVHRQINIIPIIGKIIAGNVCFHDYNTSLQIYFFFFWINIDENKCLQGVR